ncbi:MAG: TlpA family protein disulfide reductase [Candidatus Saganbacteria bacterium]|nr:TlpA family protein disulfide reductase [Candidatus Saganbacteria bacterium]
MHRKALRYIALFLLVCFWVQGLGAGVQAMGKVPRAPEAKLVAASNFTLRGLKGNVHRLSDHQGKLVFLHFWTTWCPPCRSELPTIQQMHNDSDKNKFVVLAVSVDEPQERVKQYVDNEGHTFPVLLDSDGKIARLYGIRAFPTTIIIDRSGRIIGRITGARHWRWSEFLPLIQ